MNAKDSSILWVDCRSFYDLKDSLYPQIKKLYEVALKDPKRSTGFSTYWNKHVGYPYCRYFHNRLQFCLYFDNEHDRTAWMLGCTKFNRSKYEEFLSTV